MSQDGGFIGGGWLHLAKGKLCSEQWNSCSHLAQHMADVLRQIPSDLSAGSKPEILAEARVLSHRNPACTPRRCACMHTLLSFHQFFGGHTCVIFIPRFGCADWVTFWRKDESLGVVATIQHCTPSYCVFIWVACWSQGTAFWFSKKAMQACLILSYVKCTDCFMNHYSLLIHCLSKVWAAIQPVKYFAVRKGCLICERGLDSFYNIPSLQLISFEVPGFL